MEPNRGTLVGVAPPNADGLLAQVDAIENLPVLSEHHQRLQHLVEDDSASLSDVAALVERDPTFAANLIRIANSPIFAQRVPVDSIRRAIQVIGFKGVADMSLTLEVVQGFGFPEGLDVETFWDHAVNTAVLAKDLAAQNGIDRDRAYLVGLLHDVSFLALCKFLPDVFAALVAVSTEEVPIHVACQRQQGCFPLDVTSRLMRRWNFDAEVIEATALLADPAREGDEGARKLALTVHNAHEVCQQYQQGCLPWDRLAPLPDGLRLSSSREHTFASGLSAAILSCC